MGAERHITQAARKGSQLPNTTSTRPIGTGVLNDAEFAPESLADLPEATAPARHAATAAAPPAAHARGGARRQRLSRRNVLGLAGVGVAAVAGGASYLATSLGSAAPAKPAAHTPAAAPESATVPGSKGAVVVYLQDVKSGELEIMNGTSQTTIHDKALAAQIARAAK